MATILNTVFKLKRGVAARWAEVNPILQQGEPGFVIDLNRLKIGDGVTSWNDLPYLDNEQLLADNETIVIENNTIKLKGFIEAQAGAQLCKNANGELEWILPSTETIDGLTLSIENLKTEMLEVKNEVSSLTTNGETLLNRVQIIEHQINDSGEGTIDAIIDQKINKFANEITEDGKINTVKELFDYIAIHGPEVQGIINNINTLQELVGDTSVNSQILENNKVLKEEINDKFISRKFEIASVPTGTLVDYSEEEIRIMCPKDTKWTKQTVGEAGNPNIYYMAFKAYAPENAVSFKEGDRGQIVDKMYDFNDSFAGIDSYGRKYSICWLALASYNETTDTWTYYGANSKSTKYIGWSYIVEWYDADGIVIGRDSIRINLSNEECHDIFEPYYSINTVQNIKINDTVLSAIDHQINISLSDAFDIDENGTINVKQISWDVLVPGESTLILDGGDAVLET